jgi:hypothetical protein
MTSSGEMKITFYSTSSKEENKSKYPKQVKTSYTIADDGGTEINFGKPLNNMRPKTPVEFTQAKESRVVSDADQIKEDIMDKKLRNGEKIESPKRSRSGRIVKNPDRYEPVENVVDDYDDNDYDSDYSSEN